MENLDFYGTNDGLLLREAGHAGTWSDNGGSSDGSDTDPGEAAVSGMSWHCALLLWRLICCACMTISLLPHQAYANDFRFRNSNLPSSHHQYGAPQERRQLAYAMTLEQQNMHLHQENLDLREVWLLVEAVPPVQTFSMLACEGAFEVFCSIARNVVLIGAACAACRSWSSWRSG